MLTNFYEYDEINRLAFHIMLSLILSPLAKAAYLAITRYFSANSFISIKCLDLKAKKRKPV